MMDQGFARVLSQQVNGSCQYQRGIVLVWQVAKWLSSQAFDAIVSSDLRRAVQTAEAIAQQQGLQVWLLSS